MALSEEKIMALMDLFVRKLGWEAFYLPKTHQLHRMAWRKGLAEKNFRSLAFFNTPSDEFRKMFIDPHSESTLILRFYEKKLNL